MYPYFLPSKLSFEQIEIRKKKFLEFFFIKKMRVETKLYQSENELNLKLISLEVKN